MPRQVARVGGGAGLARAIVDLPERFSFRVRVAHAGPQRGAIAEDRAGAGVQRRLMKRVVVGEDVLERALGAAIRRADLVIDASPRPAEEARIAAPGVEAADF